MRIHQPTAGALLALTLGLAGCGGGRDAAAAIPRERFVAANVALRSVPDSVGNAAALRTQALRKHRVTEKELKAFVAAHGRDAGFMSGVWREISQKVDSAWDAKRPRETLPDAPAGDVPPGGDDRVAEGAPGDIPPGGDPRLEEGPPGRMPAPDPALSAGRMPAAPPPLRPGTPIRIRETPAKAGGDTTRLPPRIRRPPEEPPADTRPWVPGDSARLRLPPRP